MKVTNMKCVYFDGTLKYIENYPKPVLQQGEALIRVHYAAVCNTDKEILKGYKGFHGVLGHEFVGIVEEAEDLSLIGKRVVGEINIGCGYCDFCKEGMKNHCLSRKVLGIEGKDGAFAEYITLPIENLVVVPDNIEDLNAVFVEPLAAALEVTEFTHIRPSSKVAIIGNGKLGRMIAEVVSSTGCDLTIIGNTDKHMKPFEAIGKTTTWNNFHEKSVFDVVIECTGNPQGIKGAEKIVKPRGTVILKSTYVGDASLNPTSWVVNEISFKGSRCGPMAAAVRMLQRKMIELDFLTGKVYALKDFKEAFESKEGKSIFDLTK